MLVDKISRKIKIKKKRSANTLHSSREGGLAQCKSTCGEHTGSDINFENITLCLDQLPLKIQFTKEKRTLKTLVLSREANTLPQYKSSCKEQASSDKNLSVKPYSLISCCFKLRNGKRAACNHGVMDARGRLLRTKEA